MTPKFEVNDKVIVNTGGDDSEATISDKNKLHGYYWAAQKSYLCLFGNNTAQYIPEKYIRKA